MSSPMPIPFDALESAPQRSSAGAPAETVALLSQVTGVLFFDFAAFKKHMGVYPPVTMVRR